MKNLENRILGGNMEISQEIKSNLKLNLVILEHYGVYFKRVGNQLLTLCPFHGEHNPSCVLWEGDKGWFIRCRSCGNNMNIINFVMQREGMNFIQAINFIQDNFYNAECLNRAVRVLDLDLTKPKYDKINFDDYIKELHKTGPYTKKRNEFLKDKGFMGHRHELAEIFKLNNIIMCCDQFAGAGALRKVHPFNNLCFYFPDYNFAQYRTYNGKKINASETVPIISSQATKPTNKTMIVEGITDMITANLKGYNALCLNGAGNHGKLLNLLNHEEIYILALDNDERGQEETKKILEKLKLNNYHVRSYRSIAKSGVKDLNELYKHDIIE